MKCTLLALVCSLLGNQLLAQSNQRGITINLIEPASFTRIGARAWGSGGAGVSTSGSKTSPLGNPAGMDFSRTSLYIEVGKRFSTEWLYGIEKDGQFPFPTFTTLGWNTGDWNFAIGYASPYAREHTMSGEMTTPTRPEGTGEWITAHDVDRIHTAFGSANLLVGEKIWTGVTVGLNYIYHRSTFSDLGMTGTAFGMSIIFGALVKPIPGLDVGLACSFSSHMKFDGGYTLESYRYTANIPWSIDLGTTFRMSPTARVIMSADYRGWSDVAPSLEDAFQFHGGFEVDALSALTVSAGVFTEQSIYEKITSYTDQTFLSVGCTWSVSDVIAVTAVLLDSHLFGTSIASTSTGEPFRQTYFAVGAGYRW